MNSPKPNLPNEAVAWLRFAEGESRFPLHALPIGDFLIGSRADCDVCLGDGILPPLHSIIRITEDTASWTAMVRTPGLIVNGQSVRHTYLQDGDLVEIGPFRMTFRLIETRAENERQRLLDQEQSSELTADAVVNLEPEQLVDAIHAEIEQMRLLDRSTLHGLNDLFIAASNSANNASEPLRNAANDPFELISEQLRRQQARLDTMSEAIDHIVQQQRVMTEIMHHLTQQVSAISTKPPGFRKAG